MDDRTIDIYEQQSDRYEARRSPRWSGEARALGERAPSGPVVDLGSGPGWYTPLLRPDSASGPVVALDAAAAMLRRTREVAPSALVVQADLSALPFRERALAGGWARNTYVHLRVADVPMALHELHRALAVGAPIEATFLGGDRGEGRGLFPDDDLPGRWFSTWSAQLLADVVQGAGFDLDELEERSSVDREQALVVRASRARTLADTVGAGMRLLVCGLNPSLTAADAGIGFFTPGNRFWPAAVGADLVDRDRDPTSALVRHGIGMTDLVKRATPRADALATEEYRRGVERLERLCTWLRPGAVCVVGLAGWRAAVDRSAVTGVQPEPLGGSPVYVMPSTSGANASSRLADLVGHLHAALALAAPPA